LQLPDQLDVSDFLLSDSSVMAAAGVSDLGTKYRLVGLSNHMGGLGSGHYTAHIKVGEDWFDFNDASTSRLELSPSASPNVDGYLLFYVREGLSDSQIVGEAAEEEVAEEEVGAEAEGAGAEAEVTELDAAAQAEAAEQAAQQKWLRAVLAAGLDAEKLSETMKTTKVKKEATTTPATGGGCAVAGRPGPVGHIAPGIHSTGGMPGFGGGGQQVRWTQVDKSGEVVAATNVSKEKAQQMLAEHGGDVNMAIMMLRSMSVETCQGSTAAMQESPTPIKPAPIARSDSLIVADNTGKTRENAREFIDMCDGNIQTATMLLLG